MMQYTCNKCGDEMEELVFENSRTAIISFNGPFQLGEDSSDVHLCRECTRRFKKWVRGESELDDNPSELAF